MFVSSVCIMQRSICNIETSTRRANAPANWLGPNHYVRRKQ
ncbi:hypothetical protein RMSM_00955 [Rhodopirellula maiorica SM1]|uniref:Uncharacterized protein n=1 Tax=Rhodopirellula maiorica SM1 TaxID=1265738 RepID=M5RS58_9BACT|nr:hypothetical protein RMSM_00955 [Rhodopirellula maiorica SM1]